MIQLKLFDDVGFGSEEAHGEEDKVRFEFRKHAKETDPGAVRELFLVGYTHLDTLETQGQHLTALAKMDMRAIKGVRNTLEE